MTRTLFIALTFFVIVAIIVLADSLATAVAIISIATSFFVISSISAKIGPKTTSVGTPPLAPAEQLPAEEAQAVKSEPSADVMLNHTDEISMYGEDYAQMRSFVTSYQSPAPRAVSLASMTECTKDVDTLNAQIAARRARDKASMDGATIKDADYWRAWHSDELAQAESAPWWGEH